MINLDPLHTYFKKTILNRHSASYRQYSTFYVFSDSNKSIAGSFSLAYRSVCSSTCGLVSL